MQTFAKFGAALVGDAVDRTHAAARDPLLGDGGDQLVLFELADRIIERADIHIDVAFDHRRLEPALDLIRVEIAAVQYAEDEEPCIHS